MENQVQPWYRRPEAVRTLGAVLFFLALIIRSIGIQWGLPSETNTFSLHPDEPINFAVSQSISVGKGQLDPGFYNYGTLYLTCVSVAGDVIRGYGGFDLSQPGQALEYSRRVHLAGRWISAIAGSATALIIYLALVRRTGKLAALLGGMAIAVAPGHVVHSRFMTVDVFAAALMAAALYLALRLSEPRETPWNPTQRWKLILGASFLAGLSGGTKYNGILTLLPVAFLAMDGVPIRQWAKEAAASAGVALLAFLFATPGALLNTSKFWTDFQYEVRHASTGHGLVFEQAGNGFGLTVFHLIFGFGLVLVILGLMGLFWSCRTKDRASLALAGFSLIFFLLLGTAEIFFLRYTFPLYIGVAWGVGMLVHLASTNVRLRHGVVVASMLSVAGIPFGGAITASTWTGYMVNADVRTVAAQVISELAKKESDPTVGVVSDPWFYTPTFYPLTSAPRSVPIQIRLEAMSQTTNPRVVQYLGGSVESRFDWDVRLIRELKPSFITYSSFEAYDLERLSKLSRLRPEVQLQVDRYREFQTGLRKEYELILENMDSLEFVHDLAYIRPRISVWKRKATP